MGVENSELGIDEFQDEVELIEKAGKMVMV